MPARWAKCTSRPCSSAMRLTIDRPRPLPGLRLPGRAMEAVAEPRQQLGAHARTVVLDDDALRFEPHVDRDGGRPVAQRVVEQVAQQRGQQRLVTVQRHGHEAVRRPVDRDLGAALLDERQAVVERVLEHAPPVDHRVLLERRAFGAREREQLFEQVLDAFDALAHLRARMLESGAVPAVGTRRPPLPTARAALPAACAARVRRRRSCGVRARLRARCARTGG